MRVPCHLLCLLALVAPAWTQSRAGVPPSEARRATLRAEIDARQLRIAERVALRRERSLALTAERAELRSAAPSMPATGRATESAPTHEQRGAALTTLPDPNAAVPAPKRIPRGPLPTNSALESGRRPTRFPLRGDLRGGRTLHAWGVPVRARQTQFGERDDMRAIDPMLIAKPR